MPFLSSPEYQYSYNKSISSPLRRHKNEHGEVRRIKDNILPPQGFAQVISAISHGKTRPKQKFIYTIRHGKAHHNALSKEFSKAIAWRFLGKLADNFDPRLTPDGMGDAEQAGWLLGELIRDEGAPRPLCIYTSPLRRCIETAMHTIAALRRSLGEQHPQRVTLHIKEGLREWKGYDHNHQSDRRDVTANITAVCAALRAELGLGEGDLDIRLDGAQDREDDPVMRETYVDVDRRVRRVLDDLFDGPSTTTAAAAADGGEAAATTAPPPPAECAMLVLHNRSNKSVLRVLGHRQAEVHRLDMENCAVLGYLMGREALDEGDAEARDRAEEMQWLKDRDLAEAEKKARHAQAARDIEAYRRADKDKLRKLKDYLACRAAEGDPEAAKALADLYRLAPELKLVRT